MPPANQEKMIGSEKIEQDSSIKRVTRKFLDVSPCSRSRAKQRQRDVQKKCAARAKLFFPD